MWVRLSGEKLGQRDETRQGLGDGGVGWAE